MKKVIGYFVLSLPFVGMAVLGYFQIGVIGTLVSFGLATLIIGLCFLGVNLTSK